MKIIRDSREQNGFAFSGKQYDAEVIIEGLPSGDYSLPSFQDRISLERKELNDLISCLMGSNRARFERELQRLSHYDVAAVVIEASFQDVADGLYRSDMLPHSALQSIMSFQVRYRVPFVWCGSRQAAEYFTYWTLQKFAYDIQERAKALTKAQATTKEAAA